MKIRLMFLVGVMLYGSAFAQMLIKNSAQQNVLRVTHSGKLAVGLNLTSDPVQGLEVRSGALMVTQNAGAGRVLMSNASGVGDWTAAGGDLSGAYNALRLDAIQGKPVTMPTTITTNYALKWNGSAWVPAVDADTKPSQTTVESGKELAWNGSAFVAQALLYVRGYISPQQTFVPNVFDLAATAKKVNFITHFSSDGTSQLSQGVFTAPRTAYFFVSALVAIVEEPTEVAIAIFKSTDGGSTWLMELNGTASGLRTPTTAQSLSGIVQLNQGDRITVGLRNTTVTTCKSAAYSGVALYAQNNLTIMELP